MTRYSRCAHAGRPTRVVHMRTLTGTTTVPVRVLPEDPRHRGRGVWAGRLVIVAAAILFRVPRAQLADLLDTLEVLR